MQETNLKRKNRMTITKTNIPATIIIKETIIESRIWNKKYQQNINKKKNNNINKENNNNVNKEINNNINKENKKEQHINNTIIITNTIIKITITTKQQNNKQ
jgi:hypothetical protein